MTIVVMVVREGFEMMESVERLRGVGEKAENLRFQTICSVMEILSLQ